MAEALISVIVPVYKAEAYLQRCIDSIRNQTYRNLEIILVDDGSPDRCGKMCDAFAVEDSRICVIHKSNGGQAAARNDALNIASGEYIGFVDSDDWIEPEMYQTLYNLLIEYGAQISACGIRSGVNSFLNLDYPMKKDIEIYTKTEALLENTKNQKITNSLCDKLWSRSIFSDIRLPCGEVYEDMKILPQCLEKADKIVYDPTAFYHYNQTAESTTRGTFDAKKFEEAAVALARAEDYRIRYPELYDAAMTDYIRTCIAKIWDSRGTPSCAQQRKAMIREMKGPLPPQSIALLRRNARIKLYALRLGTPIFELLMTLHAMLKGEK